MSVKFEKETLRETGSRIGDSIGVGIDKRQGLMHELGERLTGGSHARKTGYLAVRDIDIDMDIALMHLDLPNPNKTN